MKKCFLFIVVAALILCSTAFAETVLVDNCYRIDLPDSFVEGDIEDEDDEDLVAYYYSDKGNIALAIYIYSNDGYTISEVAEALQEDYNTTGLTTINGIDAAYGIYEEDGETYVGYTVINESSDNIIDLEFYVGDDAAKTQSQSIMNTLKLQ